MPAWFGYIPAWLYYMPAWASIYRPSLLLTCFFNILHIQISHITYISHIDKGTLVYPGLYPRH
jgi:hypothetical protein